MQVKDQESHALEAEAQKGSFQMTIQKEVSVATDLAGHSEKAQTVREDRSAKVLKGEASVATDHADRSAKAQTAREDRSAKVKKEKDSEVTVQDVLSVTMQKEEVVTDHADHSERAQKEGASEATEKADSEIQERKASQRRTSTISVTRTRAESAE